MISKNFYINVARVMRALLPRPARKMELDILDQDRAETLDELGIVKEGFKVC